MSRFRIMFIDKEHNHNIRCRFIYECFKVESSIQTTEELLSEIEKTHPDVVVMDLSLFAKIDGIETSRKIRYQFDVPVIYI